MSIYVYNKVIVSRDVFLELFLDSKPFGNKSESHKLYISFNKIWGVDNIYDVPDQIHYGSGTGIQELDYGMVEIYFVTQNLYPIETIVKLISKHHKVVWYVAEETHTYISKFYYSEKTVCEQVYPLEKSNSYSEWIKNMDGKLADYDCGVWYYETNPDMWEVWNIGKGRLFDRYRFGLPIKEFQQEILGVADATDDAVNRMSFTCLCGMKHTIGKVNPDPFKYFIYDGVEMDMLKQKNQVIYPNDPEQRGQFWVYQCIGCGRLHVFRHGCNQPEFVFKRENN